MLGGDVQVGQLKPHLPIGPTCVFIGAMAFTLRQLQYFVAVAEQGTVSGAAQNSRFLSRPSPKRSRNWSAIWASRSLIAMRAD